MCSELLLAEPICSCQNNRSHQAAKFRGIVCNTDYSRLWAYVWMCGIYVTVWSFTDTHAYRTPINKHTLYRRPVFAPKRILLT